LSQIGPMLTAALQLRGRSPAGGPGCWSARVGSST